MSQRLTEDEIYNYIGLNERLEFDRTILDTVGHPQVDAEREDQASWQAQTATAAKWQANLQFVEGLITEPPPVLSERQLIDEVNDLIQKREDAQGE